ncbi:ankyrin repeat containing protein [Colletotrichum tofieldiae]|nr:ankyrin repeat containing protein [Colletotrichum tofieldiae]
MGNAESRQLFNVLVVACNESGDNISTKWLETSRRFAEHSAYRRQLLEAVADFLRSIVLPRQWNALPTLLTSAVTDALSPRFETKPSIDCWVEAESSRKLSDDPATRLYCELRGLSKATTRFDVTKKYVFLIAFFQLREKYRGQIHDPWRDSFATYLSTRVQDDDDKTLRSDCSSWGQAGKRLQEFTNALDGYGALLCDFDLNFSAYV